ncbi:hypothetical protein CRYUN_Cryun01aG0059600 [Craigia yunnanensis]
MLRDAEGYVLGALQTVVKGVMKPSKILEGDVIKVVRLLNKATQDFSTIGTLIEDGWQGVKRNFLPCIIEHVRREANEASHTLAKSVMSTKNELFWVEECPDNILAIGHSVKDLFSPQIQ